MVINWWLSTRNHPSVGSILTNFYTQNLSILFLNRNFRASMDKVKTPSPVGGAKEVSKIQPSYIPKEYSGLQI